MLRETLLACLTVLMFLAGCVQPDSMIEDESSNSNQIPFELTFSADTLDREEDGTPEFDLKEQLEESNMTIVSVHRWGEFESKSDVEKVFGIENESEHYTPWTIVTPSELTQAEDFNTEQSTGASIYSAYGNPGTPTLQVIAPNGVLAWQSKTYWANETVFEDGFSFFERQVNEE